MNKAIPENPDRVILVNPTKYLGNLLLAGGLMQAFAAHCRERNIALRIVLDESFRDLCDNSFPAGTLVYFPRARIKKAGVFRKIGLYHDCVRQLRSFRAELAFNIEEDAATSHLTRLSGAACKLGCSARRHKRGYDRVIPVSFEDRDPARMHRWYSYYEVFAALGMAESDKQYLSLGLEGFPQALETKLKQSGWVADKATIALHAGATKEYKKWPPEHMAALIEKLLAADFQPILLGAGQRDREDNQKILALLEDKRDRVIDLCDRLSLVELAQVLKSSTMMVGNDSGPFHLGSALGIPGLVLWGPTNKAIWGPLGEQSEIVQGNFACDPACNKGYCLHGHRCMREILPETVFARITRIAADGLRQR